MTYPVRNHDKQAIAEEAMHQRSNEYRDQTTVTFLTGVLTGAAIASIVPWDALQGVSLPYRAAMLAGIGAVFVVFRLGLRSRTIRRTGGVLAIMGGGFLMSSGQHLAPSGLTGTLVAVGAAIFLCGVTILFRDRIPTRIGREEAINRLLEADVQASESASQHAPNPRSSYDEFRSDLTALARGAQIRPDTEVPVGQESAGSTPVDGIAC